LCGATAFTLTAPVKSVSKGGTANESEKRVEPTLDVSISAENTTRFSYRLPFVDSLCFGRRVYIYMCVCMYKTMICNKTFPNGTHGVVRKSNKTSTFTTLNGGRTWVAGGRKIATIESLRSLIYSFVFLKLYNIYIYV